MKTNPTAFQGIERQNYISY